MKKLLFLFILIFTAFSVSALASAFDVGVNLSYNNADEVVDESVYSGSLNLDKIAVGLEMRGNISNFQMTIAGDISILDTQSVMFSGIFGAGISVDLFKYLKFGITTGPKVTYIYRGKMNSVDNNGDLIEADTFFTALAKAHVRRSRRSCDVHRRGIHHSDFFQHCGMPVAGTASQQGES